MSVIQARGMKKNFGSVAALDSLDLDVPAGRIVGLIGPNGSGKTTAIKSLLGLCRLDAGELNVLGMDPARHRHTLMARVAYIADTGILPRWMKVADLIDFVDSVHASFDKDQAQATLAATDIRADARIRTLSKGMHVQLHLALVLAIDAELLILDEPTLGLDIIYRQRFYDALLNDFYNDKRSILITTHEVREIEHILTDVVFLDHGRQCLASSMEDIGKEFRKVVVGPAQQGAARALNPISERTSLQGSEFIFRGVPAAALAPLGESTQPNLPELFIAIEGGNR